MLVALGTFSVGTNPSPLRNEHVPIAEHLDLPTGADTITIN
jgi:hypothetical protein